MMRSASFDGKRDASSNDDISSLNSDLVQARFRAKKNHNQNKSGSQLSNSNSDYGSDKSSEMEVLSEDEQVNEILRRHSVLLRKPSAKPVDVETQTEFCVQNAVMSSDVGTQTRLDSDMREKIQDTRR